MLAAPDHSNHHDTHIQPPVRIAVAHSMREIFGPDGGEFVGQKVADPETKRNLGYRRGNTEFLIQEGLRRIQEQTKIAVELALVLYDDTPEHMAFIGLDPETHYEEGKWPWPHDLPVADGRTIHDITVNVPMYTEKWKRAKKAGSSEAQAIRAEREEAFSRTLKNHRIDLFVTDSITYIFQRLMTILQQYGGRIINYHPAVLEGERAIPGLFPTKSALHRFRRGVIFGERGKEIAVPHLKGHRGHGATVHETTADIDRGPILVSREIPDLVRPDDTQQTLRHRVFEVGHDILVEGITKYLQTRMNCILEAREERSRKPVLREEPIIVT